MRRRSTKTVAAVLCLIFLSSSLTGWLVWSYASSSSNPLGQSNDSGYGSGCASYTWCVFTNTVGGTQYYYALAGLTSGYPVGAVVFGGPTNLGGVAGTSFSALMNQILNLGGTTLIENGLYVSTANITVTTSLNVTVVGSSVDFNRFFIDSEGNPTGVVIVNPSSSVFTFNGAGTYTLKNLRIEGKLPSGEPYTDGTYSSGAGISVQKSNYLELDNIQVNRKAYGIYFTPLGAFQITGAVILNNIVLTYNDYGLYSNPNGAGVPYVYSYNLQGYLNDLNFVSLICQYNCHFNGLDDEGSSWAAPSGNRNDDPISITCGQDCQVTNVGISGGRGTTPNPAADLLGFNMATYSTLILSDVIACGGQNAGVTFYGSPTNYNVEFSNFYVGIATGQSSGYRGCLGSFSGSAIAFLNAGNGTVSNGVAYDQPRIGVNNLGTGVVIVRGVTPYFPAEPFSPTVGVSPYTYTNTLVTAETCYVSGGTVSSIVLIRAGVSTIVGPTSGGFYLLPKDSLKITYTSAPTFVCVPQD